jgi:circadian clock protein KaiC
MTIPTHTPSNQLLRSPTGIPGLDEITFGGLPTGRPTLVCGGPGSGKTLLGISFLVNGIRLYDEPGVLMSFDENAAELAQDVQALGFDLPGLVEAGKLVVDYVHVDRSEIEETGEFDLDGLFVRLDDAVRTAGAKRVVLDTVESLFSGLENETILRAELRRLLRWSRDRGLTTIITGEQGERTLTRHGLEEYVTDAVIALDHRVDDQISTRRVRVVKYRGSQHGTNEYPFLIDSAGISVLPVTSLLLEHPAPTERVPSGLPELDGMLGGEGYYKGSTILVSGTSGTGKTTLAAHFARGICGHGLRCLFSLSEESPAQMVRNMHMAGIDLQPYVDRGLLHLQADRPSRYGLEAHLAIMHRAIDQFRPNAVILDPVTSLLTVGAVNYVRGMLTRLIDYLKTRGITTMFTSLTPSGSELETTETMISSLMDSWIVLSLEPEHRRQRRWIRVLKSRGMAHSDESRPFRIGGTGIEIALESGEG